MSNAQPPSDSKSNASTSAALRSSILESVAPRTTGRPLRVLDLCSGLNGWTTAWRERNHNCLGLELEATFRPELNMDVRHLAKDPHALLDILVARGWRPDVILASPPCEGFSVASIGKMWEQTPEGPKPKHETARYCLSVLEGVLEVNAKLQPAYIWIENPRGMMRKMPQMAAFRRVTITYCAYGETRMKPTDLWGRWPETWQPRPMCTGSAKNGLVTLDGRVFVLNNDGQPCHEHAPRGAKTGTQGIRGAENRAVVAHGLSLETCLASEAALWAHQPAMARRVVEQQKLDIEFVQAFHKPGRN